MGLLDDLEQESQRRKAGLDGVERLKQEREGVYKTVLEPGMQKLYEYLSKLTTNLAFLKPKIQVRHEIPSYGAIVANVEHEYDLKINTVSPTAKEIALQFNATVATEECPAVVVQGSGKVRSMNSFFQKYRLAGIHEFKKDDSGEVVQATFRARGKIPMGMTAHTDIDNGQVKLAFTNFDSHGVLSKSVSAAQFNEQLFDEIGRFLAREASNLFREALPDDYRKQLQQKIQQDQLKRKWESKIAEQQDEELANLKRNQSVRSRLDKAVESVKSGAPSLLDRVKGIFRKG